MKKLLCLLLAFLLLPSALASGLLPSSGDMFGAYMPSIEFALGVRPASDQTADGVRTQYYKDFSDESYLDFSRYLAAWGCLAENVRRDGYVLSLDIVKDGARISFTFDRAKQEALTVYPANTRPETSASYEAQTAQALPQLESVYGVKLPNPSAVFGTKGSSGSLGFKDFRVNIGTRRIPVYYDEERFDWTTYAFSGVSESDYALFGAYLGEEGMSLESERILYNASGYAYLYSDLKKEGATLNVCYSVKLRQLVVRYSPDSYPDTEVGRYAFGGESVLPDSSLICAVMPSLSATLLRRPDSRTALADGSARLEYQNVSESDFDAFNIYLAEYGCELKDYALNDKTLSATLTKDGESFSLVYDSLTGKCSLTYPLGTHVEEVELPLQVGDIYTFGAYEQDNNISNGREPIEWIILDVNADGALTLISRYALDAKPYNTSYTDVTWETCTLRKWLNEEFYQAAFSTEEQTKIKTVHLGNEDNPYWDTKGGKDTDDKVWLLSINEVCDYYGTDKLYSYFTDDNSRICNATAYAVARGAGTYNGACWWLLRSPGSDSRFAALVINVGYVSIIGSRVNIDAGSVRPVVVAQPF